VGEADSRRRPGRPATIDAEQIVDAAISVIDESGIEACTMRAVADRLGVTPMSIYRHITDKADLLGRIPESLLGPVAADVARKRRALSALSAVADGLGDVLESHPNLAPLFHQPTPGPAMMRAAAHCVELLIAEGCPPQDAFELLRALVALVVGQAVTTHGTRSDFGTRLFLVGAASLLTTSPSSRSSPRPGPQPSGTERQAVGS
jgi:AcrR family transcriptional regulator